MTGAWIFVRDALRDALALLLPTSCAGCGADDADLCAMCRRELSDVLPVRRCIDGGLVVSAAGRFDGALAHVLRSLKEDGRTGVAAPLSELLRRSWIAAGGGSGACVAVPIPASRRAFRRRGFRPVELIARRAGLPVHRLLRLVKQPDDQRGLDRAERWRNVQGSMRARPSTRSVILIEDVVTTGSTLREAARALDAVGVRVVSAAVIADTPARGELARSER